MPFLKRFSEVVDGNMQKGFYHLGMFIGGRPWASILICLVVVAASGAGFSNFTQESRGDKLWVPQNSQAQRDGEYVNSVFGLPVRNEQIIATNKQQGGNVLTVEFMTEFMSMYNAIFATTGTVDGQTYSFADLCYKPAGPRSDETSGCSVLSVLDLFSYNATNIPATNAALLDAINVANPQALSGRDLSMSFVLGGAVRSGGRIVSAEAVSLSIQLNDDVVLNGGTETSPKAEAWEQNFLDYVRADGKFTYLDTAVFAARSFSDEFGGAIGGDVILLSTGYLLIIIYTVIMLGRFNWVESRAGVSVTGVIAVGLAIVMSFGLSSAFGAFYGPVHSVLPLLLIGLGIDDMFVITNAVQMEAAEAKYSELDTNDRVQHYFAHALSHAGVSITITSVTDFVAFLIGTSTALPALSSFCVFAAVGILAVYFTQIFFFGAMLVYDCRRVENHRVDCCPCICAPRPPRDAVCCASCRPSRRPQADEEAAAEEGAAPAKQKFSGLGLFMKDKFGPFIMRTPVRVVVLVVAVGVTVASVVGAVNLSLDFDETSFLPDDSYLQEFVKRQEKYFAADPVASPVNIYMRPATYTGSDTAILALHSAVNGYTYINSEATRSWYVDFKTWVAAAPAYNATLSAEGLPPTEAEMVTATYAYIQGAGARYKNDVVFLPTGSTAPTSIKASRFESAFKGLTSATKQVEALDGIRDTVSGAVAGNPLNAFPYSFLFSDWEQYKIVGEELLRNVGLTLAAVAVITLILIAHPLTAATVTIVVAMVIFNVMGLMYVWDVAVDAVAVVNLTLALGLAVDYSAHVAHQFMLVTGTRTERAIKALANIGGSVLNGAISTFLAILMLASSKSYVFRVFFKMFVGIIGFGVIFGLVALPVILSFIGPDSFVADEEVTAKEIDLPKMSNGAAKSTVAPSSGDGKKAEEADV